MKKKLEQLRNRPDHEKNHVVKIAAIIVTAVIVVIYLVLLAFGPKEAQPEDSPRENALDAFSEILNTGFDEIGNITTEIQDQRDQINLNPENIQQIVNEINLESETTETTETTEIEAQTAINQINQ